MLLARLVTKYPDRTSQQNWPITSYDFYSPPSAPDDNIGRLTLHLPSGETVSLDGLEPPQDYDGIPYQRVFIMNMEGQNIDSILIQPSAGWDKYIEEHENVSTHNGEKDRG